MALSVTIEGLHPTTESCLKALQWLQEQQDFANILEIGCGSGILSLVAAGIWDKAPVLAVDISEKAVADTQFAIGEYKLESRVRAERSDGFSNPAIAKDGPYSLIICNLLADTLIHIAHDVRKNMENGGYLLISGILSWRSTDIERIYGELGFEIIEKTLFSPWQSYIMRKTA